MHPFKSQTNSSKFWNLLTSKSISKIIPQEITEYAEIATDCNIPYAQLDKMAKILIWSKLNPSHVVCMCRCHRRRHHQSTTKHTHNSSDRYLNQSSKSLRLNSCAKFIAHHSNAQRYSLSIKIWRLIIWPVVDLEILSSICSVIEHWFFLIV